MKVPARLLIAVIGAMTALVAPPLASTSGAGPAPPGLECGQDVTTDVVLTHDLHCPTGRAFRIVASGVTVDLGGHTVTVTREPDESCGLVAFGDPPGGCSIDIFADSVSLTNGRLVGVEVGIFDSRSVDLSRLWAQDSGLYLTGARLHHSVVVDSDVEIFGESGGPTVDHNWLRGTNVRMNNVQWGVHDFHIDSNIIDHSPRYGIELYLYCCFRPGDVSGSVTRNLVVRSALDGVNAPGDGEAGSLTAFGELTVTDNLLIGNGGDGLELSGRPVFPYCDVYCLPGQLYPEAGPIVVGGNAAYFNGGHGLNIDLLPTLVDGLGLVEPAGVVDAGGNRAFLNRERPRCVGVSCRWW